MDSKAGVIRSGQELKEAHQALEQLQQTALTVDVYDKDGGVDSDKLLLALEKH